MKSYCLNEGCYLKNGEYRITRILGQGGFGITYEAEQISLGRKVAIKEFFMKEYCVREVDTSQVSTPSEGSREQVDRFRLKFIKEARLIASLDHPNIIRVQDVFEENGTAYYVMDYMPGKSLKDKVEETGPLPIIEINKYLRQICSALDYLHSNNVLHLDVKPSNILFDKNDNIVLIDFGISKHYDENGEQTSSMPVGVSKGFAPLEQYKSGDLREFTPATDIYSLGATLFYMSTGNVPPEAISIYNEGLPTFDSSIPECIQDAIGSSMQPHYEDRPQDIRVFLSIANSNYCLNEDTTIIEHKRDVIDELDYNEQIHIDNETQKQVDWAKQYVIANISYGMYCIQRRFRWRRYPIIFLIASMIVFVVAYFTKDAFIETCPAIITQTMDDPIIQFWFVAYFISLSMVLTLVIYWIIFYRKERFIPEWEEEVVEKETSLNYLAKNYSLKYQLDFHCSRESDIFNTAFGLCIVFPFLWVLFDFLGDLPNVTCPFTLGIVLWIIPSLLFILFYNSILGKDIKGLESWHKIENINNNRQLIDKSFKPRSISDISRYFDDFVKKEKWLIELGQDKTIINNWSETGIEYWKDGRRIKYNPRSISQPLISKGIGVENGHEFVDLGLSVKWATCNIGAIKPEQAGGFFAWGETSEKMSYARSNYSFLRGGDWYNKIDLSKYNNTRSDGIIDNKEHLELCDDVCNKKWGGNWHMPTKEEFQELINHCIWEPVTYNSINGILIKSKKYGPEHFIFLPITGYKEGNWTCLEWSGYYWSNTLETSRIAACLHLDYQGGMLLSESRLYGLAVRAVCN